MTPAELKVAVDTYAAWYALKLLLGVRVKAEDEVNGLDVAEIGMEAYPDAREIEEKIRVEHPVAAGGMAAIAVPVATGR